MVEKKHHRLPAREVDIGGVALGGNHPVRIQSMTNTPTTDVKATTAQCIRAFEAGADYMRISIPNKASVEALKKIKKQLNAAGFNNPLIADIHYKPQLAMDVAPIVSKIRINPGNFITPSHNNSYHNRASQNSRASHNNLESQQNEYFELLIFSLKPLINTCSDHGTAMRIGTNAGSLPAHVLAQHGYTAKSMVQATHEYLAVFEALDFDKLVISLKSSNPIITTQAYRLMAESMMNQQKVYPLHTGVTEAGEGLSGRARSALGIITLLKEGIGDTIRVSLTEPPESEIAFAKKIVKHFQTVSKVDSTKTTDKYDLRTEKPLGKTENNEKHVKGNQHHYINTEENNFPEESQTDSDWCEPVLTPAIAGSDTDKIKQLINHGLIAKKAYNVEDSELLIINLVSDFGLFLLEKKLQGMIIKATGVKDKGLQKRIVQHLFQAAGLYQFETEFISCPTCARTSFDMSPILKKLKQELSGHPGLKIAVMGCMVNGPGEMAGSDYGLIGTAQGKVNIYAGAECIKKNIEPGIAIKLLSDIIITHKNQTNS